MKFNDYNANSVNNFSDHFIVNLNHQIVPRLNSFHTGLYL